MPGQALKMLFAYAERRQLIKPTPADSQVKTMFNSSRFQSMNTMRTVMRSPPTTCSACGH
jgi:hypothetical protein